MGKTQIAYPNGTETDYDYSQLWNTSGGIETVTNKRGSTVLSSFKYTFNAQREKISSQEYMLNVGETSSTNTTITWQYDADGHLTDETLNDGVAADGYHDTYSYDPDGNPIGKVHATSAGTETTTNTYNGDGELTQSIDTVTGTTTYGYDANGSQINSSNGSVTTTYAYDVRNRLSSVTTGGVTTTYGYDDAGNRVSETTGGTTTYYLIDSNNPTGYAKPIEQWTSTTGNRSTATLSMSYVIGDRVLAQATGSGVVSYLLIDGQDNTRALTNSSGAVTATFNYSAFGDVLGATYSAANPPPTMYLFQQTMFDAPSGLNIFGDGVREVQPGEDSFIESDTSAYGDLSNPTTLNLRLLEGANPISGRDPSGHFDIFELGVVGTINAISFTVLTSPITTAVVQTVALLSLIEFAVDPDFRESVLAATGGDLTQLTEVFSGSVSYFAKKTVNLAEAAATAAFASKFAPTVADGASAVVLDAAAMRTFFLARGLSQDSAAGYATSFANGSGVLREIKAGETFLRYSGPSQNAAGSFLTKGVYSTGSEAVQALDLAPKFGNDGSLVQSVTATQDTYVLEGGVANGAPGAYQAIAVDRNAFTYGPRVPTGSQP